MMYDPQPAVESLMASVPEPLRIADPVGVETFITRQLLRGHERRPFTWAAFMRERPDAYRVIPLVYDRPSRLIFLGGSGEHGQLCALLYFLRQKGGHEPGALDDAYTKVMRKAGELADRFILDGMGLRVGGPSAQMGRRRLMIGDGVRLTADELVAFAGYDRVWIR
ncbi:hypothetical protein [Rubrivivax gelatinosus]|uniref:hypothetical protein n=1 Tax=Rubrivivax gelatinosus TaxID=28068 RepID=UPI0005C12D42|nr:hypothetical protein [Rubrivivax gelatinosus]MBG6083119.1 hypothetical protein [Rubrivivax gelatinosus]